MPLNPTDQGIDNLLNNCARLSQGETLLVVREDPSLGWYDTEIANTVANAAEHMGVMTTILEVGSPGNEFDPATEKEINKHDCTIFFSRIGDQQRFSEPRPGTRSVMSYARTLEDLSSPYGCAPFAAFVELKKVINKLLNSASEIEISCPLGTSLRGRVPPNTNQEPEDVSVLRFPMGVPAPMSAAPLNGRVALSYFLTPTGSRVYEPDHVTLNGVSFAEVHKGCIQGFTGTKDQTQAISEHYARVSNKFNLDANIVHSWHAGIHPACSYTKDAADNPDLWSNTVFTNPRVLHFHTCGNYPPAEICWMIFDHTVRISGRKLWDRGVLKVKGFPEIKQVLGNWPELNLLFEHPAQDIGLSI